MKNVSVLPADWVGAMSWPALVGRISTGAGGEILSTTSVEPKRKTTTQAISSSVHVVYS